MDSQKLNYIDNEPPNIIDIKPPKIKSEIFSFPDIDVKPIICSYTNADIMSNYERKSVTPSVGLDCSENFIDLKHLNGNLDESECILQKLTEIDVKPTLCEICKNCFTSDNVTKSSFETQSICKSCEEKLPVKMQTLGKSVTSETHVCKICTESFKNYFDLKWHSLIHSRDEQMSTLCDICKKCFISDCVEESNFENRSICKSCEKKIVPVSMKAEVHMCKICTESFKNSFDLKWHLLIHSNDQLTEIFDDKLYSCEFCHESFLDKLSLEEHYLNHTKHRFTCGKCNASFKEVRSLSKHKYSHYKTKKTITKRYKCNLCSSSYSTEKLLNKHNLLHMKVTNKIHTIHSSRMKKYGSTNKNRQTLAQFCSRINATAHDVEQHKLFHQDEIFYICDDCNFCFNDKSNLMKHILSHTEVDIRFGGPSNCSNIKKPKENTLS